MKISKKGIFGAIAALSVLAFAAIPAKASVITWSGDDGAGDSVDVIFHVVDATNVIDSLIGGSITTVATGGPLATGSLLDLSKNGVKFNFDQLWNPGFDNNGIAFDFVGGNQANIYTSGQSLFLSIADFAGTAGTSYYPGYQLTQSRFSAQQDNGGGNIPEPTSLALAGLGLLAINLAGRRPKK